MTATFKHSSGAVIDLVVAGDGSQETLGTTSNHPFWNVDRQDYVQAGELELGERLQTYSGDTKRVVSKLARPGPEPVFNLEVHAEHVYYVGQQGLLVHNSDEYAPRGANVGTTFGEARPRGLAHSPLREGEIDQYRYFSNRPGDGLEGHEVWQSASTSAYGIGGRTGAIGGRNPSIAIATQNHRQIVNKLQSEMIPDAASMSALDNIKANLSVLREAQRRGVGITDRQINDAGRKAVRFYMRLLKEGAIRE